jgi:hypothetical protein
MTSELPKLEAYTMLSNDFDEMAFLRLLLQDAPD